MEKIYGAVERFDGIQKLGDNTYEVFYGLGEDEIGTYQFRQVFNFLPPFEFIKELVLDTINNDVNDKIISGFVWTSGDGTRYKVWLSMENQQNYKAIYDIAVQTGGHGVLPVMFKFGTTDNPTYHTFETLDELGTFYMQSVAFIQATYQQGWQDKDSIDWNNYKHVVDP